MNVKKQFTPHTYIINNPQRNGAVWFVYAPEESVKRFASINHNPSKIESLNLSPNEHVYGEDSSTCRATHLLLLPNTL